MNETMKQLEELCKPVADFLKEGYDPYVTVVITAEQIKLVRDEIGIPVRTAPEVPVQKQFITVVLNSAEIAKQIAKSLTIRDKA